MRIPPRHKIVVSLLFLILSAGSIQAQNPYLEINPPVWIIGSSDLTTITAHVVYPYSDIVLDNIWLSLTDLNGQHIDSELKFKSADQNGDLLLQFVPNQTQLYSGQTLTVQIDFDTLSQPIPDLPDISHSTTISVTTLPSPPKTFFHRLLDWLRSII